jgi:hypothetical protein
VRGKRAPAATAIPAASAAAPTAARNAAAADAPASPSPRVKLGKGPIGNFRARSGTPILDLASRQQADAATVLLNDGFGAMNEPGTGEKAARISGKDSNLID